MKSVRAFLLVLVVCIGAAFACKQPVEESGSSTADPYSPAFEAPVPTFGLPYYAGPLKVGMDIYLPYSTVYVPFIHVERRRGRGGEYVRIVTLSRPVNTFVDSVGLVRDSVYWYRGQSQGIGGALSQYWMIGSIRVQ